MPDTKIAKTDAGWVDKDQPDIYHPVRREARAARRAARSIHGFFKGSKSAPKTTNVTVLGMKDAVTQQPAGQIMLSGFDQKLYNRLTARHGVPADDALEIVSDVIAHRIGYNQAASYGHMREAGATHSEASIVICLGSPAISLAYGLARANGINHTDALAEALKCQAND